MNPSLRASRRATDRRFPFQSGTVSVLSASVRALEGSAAGAAPGGVDAGNLRLATVSLGGGCVGFFGVDVAWRGAASGLVVVGRPTPSRPAALASILVMTMNAAALTARQAVVRTMVFNMACSSSAPAFRK